LFGINPEGLEEERWAELFQQAFWIKRFDLRNQAEMLQALLLGKEENSTRNAEQTNENG
jgi:hypothetical protein